MSIIIGIDASRNRSGGAKAHLTGILTGSDPRAFGIQEVHVWAYKSLMDVIPDYSWLVKHTPAVLEKSLWRQMWWQYRALPLEARDNGCDILFNTDAGSLCPFNPGVTLSQDMLSFESGEMRRYGFSKARLRLLALKYIQSRSLRKAYGAIFLTRYAKKVIQKTTGSLKQSIVIHHGIGEDFRFSREMQDWPPEREIKCLYVSNTAFYKHQWHVVDALSRLRERGLNVSLLLIGGGKGNAQRRLERELFRTDPREEFVKQLEFVDHGAIPGFMAQADLFIFASSCENMPITLLEAMANGLPIACSDRGPMPEILEDGGVTFNPENPSSIAAAVEKIIHDPFLRKRIMRRAIELSERYSWERCSRETWRFLVECVSKNC